MPKIYLKWCLLSRNLHHKKNVVSSQLISNLNFLVLFLLKSPSYFICRWTETEGVKTSIPSFYATFKDKLRTLPQGADTITWLSLQDADKIESGAFYLDRKPQTKHLPFSGTKYSDEEAQRLLTVLDNLLTVLDHLVFSYSHVLPVGAPNKLVN